jgi:hypothetical protein
MRSRKDVASHPNAWARGKLLGWAKGLVRPRHLSL